TVNRGQRRKRQILDRGKNTVGIGQPGTHVVRRVLEQLAKLHDVGADNEYRLARSHQQALDVRRLRQPGRGLLEFLQRCLVKLVDRSFLRVKTQYGNAVSEFH